MFGRATRAFLALAALAAAGMSGHAFATTVYWAGGASGSWSDDGVWRLGDGSPSAAPLDGDTIAVTNAATIALDHLSGVTRHFRVPASATVTCWFADGCALSNRVLSGKLAIDDNFSRQGAFYVDAAAQLGGTGTVDAVSLASGAFLAVAEGVTDALRVSGSFDCGETLSVAMDGLDFREPGVRPVVETDDVLDAVTWRVYGNNGAELPSDEWSKRTVRGAGGKALYCVVFYAEEPVCDVAVWNDGTVGSLQTESNWGDVKPSADNSAHIGSGTARLRNGNSFSFARRMTVGSNGVATVSVGSGTLSGGVMDLATFGTEAALSVTGGSVALSDPLTYAALNVGIGEGSSGAVTLSDGEISTVGDLVIGDANGAEGSVVISSGVFRVGGTVSVANGSLELLDGTLEVRGIEATGSGATLVLAGGTLRLIGGGRLFEGFGRVELTGDVTIDTCGYDWTTDAEIVGIGSVTKAGGGRLTCSAGAFWDGATNVREGEINLAGGTVVGETQIEDGASIEDAVIDVGILNSETCPTWSNDWFSAEFSQFADKEAIGGVVYATVTNRKGAVGGAWHAPDGADAWADATAGERSLDADIAPDVRLAFVPDTSSTSDFARVTFSFWANEAADVLPAPSAWEKTGLLAYQPTDESDVSLMVLSRFGWTNFVFEIELGKRYEIRADFDFSGGVNRFVRYAVKKGVDYVPLATADGTSWFRIDAERVDDLTFAGVGRVFPTVGFMRGELHGSTFYWIGEEGDKWSDGRNWTHDPTRSGGALAEGDYPKAGDVADFSGNRASVRLASGGDSVRSVVVGTRTTFDGGTLNVSQSLYGGERAVLSGVTLNLKGGVTVSSGIEAADGTVNSLVAADGTESRLSGTMYGSGTLRAKGESAAAVGSVAFEGAAASFAGTAELVAGDSGNSYHSIATAAAANAPNASWTFDFPAAYSGSEGRFPLRLSDTTYRLGALNGTLPLVAGEEGWAKNMTLEIGALDRDCALAGDWGGVTGSGLRWVAKRATMTYSVAHTEFLEICGGGRLAVAAAGLPSSSITFTGEGGVLSPVPGAETDFSPVIVNSTQAMVFNDRGGDNVWRTALSASNVGGFVKRGVGTLRLTEVPLYSGSTVVEEGVLIIPSGTTFDSLSLGINARLVIDCASAEEKGIIAIVRSADDTVTDDKVSFENVPSKCVPETVRGTGGSVSFVSDSRVFVWTGAGGAFWANTSNWSVDGATPSELPQPRDRVIFPDDSQITVDNSAPVLSITGIGDLLINRSGYPLQSLTETVITGRLVCVSDVIVPSAYVADITNDVALKCGTLVGTANICAGGVQTLSVAAEATEKLSGTISSGAGRIVKDGAGCLVIDNCTYADNTKEIGIAEGTLQLAHYVTWPAAAMDISAGATLDLGENEVEMTSFSGAGVVSNGIVRTSDLRYVQVGGDLTIPAVDGGIYEMRTGGGRLVLTGASGCSIRIEVTDDWFASGRSGTRAVFCEASPDDIEWVLSKKNSSVVSHGDGWYTIDNGGFTIRFR